MSIDYNEVAAYLESLHHRLDQYKRRQWQNTALGMIVLLCVLLVFVFSVILRTPPIFAVVIAAFILLLGLVWLGKRVLQTNTEASRLEKEVELLRYRLVADDVSLGKPKHKEKRDEEIAVEEPVDLSQFQVGDDGELVITPPESEKRSRR